MKAAVLYGPNDIRIEQVDKPICGINDVLLKVKAIGLCGSDIRTITSGHNRIKYPQIIGHEIAGEIVSIGEKVKNYKLGDRVIVSPIVPCKKCKPCSLGWDALCENLINIGTDIPGDYAEYMLIPEIVLEKGTVLPIPETISYEEAVMTDPLAAVYACQDDANITAGDTVVIIGMGPIGNLHAELAKVRGAKTVIAVEQSQERLEMAKDFGADYLINSKYEDPVKKVRDLTNNWGAEVVISACPAIQAQQQAIFMAAKKGKVIFFGGVAKGMLTEIDTNVIHYNLLTIRGHYAYTNKQLTESFEMITSGKLNAKKYVTHKLPLEDVMKGVNLTRTGEAIKVVLEP
jgi:L-iditol 2-dehydrogenase